MILVFFLLFSCEKEEDEGSNYYYGKISTGLYPMLFNIGSYWIYEKQEDYIIDSIVVSNIYSDTFVIEPSMPGQGPYGEEQVYVVTYFSVNDI